MRTRTVMRPRHLPGHGISIVVPFHCDNPEHQRAKNWEWLYCYWRAHLPEAEIVIGSDVWAEAGQPFSKSVAVNYGVRKSSGDVIVILDADGFVPAATILECAHRIRSARDQGNRLWFIPYRQFYRLTEAASARLLASDPAHPYEFPTPPWPEDILDTSGSQLGHWYGAGIQILPREAFDIVGGWDERFRGWGGEDHAAMRATDTLYWWHKTMPGQFLHVWHPMISPEGTKNWVDWRRRMWENQSATGANEALSGRYYGAYGSVDRMRRLCDEWKTRDGDSKKD